MKIKRYLEIKAILTDDKWGPAERHELSRQLLPELLEITDELIGVPVDKPAEPAPALVAPVAPAAPVEPEEIPATPQPTEVTPEPAPVQ